MKKYGLWKDLIFKVRIWVRNEIILYLCMNVVGIIIMRKSVYIKKKKRNVLFRVVRDEKI